MDRIRSRTAEASRTRIREAAGRISIFGDEDGGKVAPNGARFDQAFLFSSEAVASDHGIILLDAWRLDQYRKNPRFISMHDIFGFESPLDQIVVGSTVYVDKHTDLPEDVVPKGRGLVGAVRFAGTDFGRNVRLLYDEGHLDMVSVRWDGRKEEVRKPFEEEVKEHGDQLWWVATRADLLEVSAVIIGADDYALALRDNGERELRVADRAMEAYQRCRDKGLDLSALDRWAESTGVIVPPARAEAGEVFTDTDPEPDPVRVEQNVDVSALVDALVSLREGVNALDRWNGRYQEIRSAIGESVAAIDTLMLGTEVEEEADDRGRTEGGEDGTEQLLELVRALVEAGLQRDEALDEFMEASKELFASISEVADALVRDEEEKESEPEAEEEEVAEAEEEPEGDGEEEGDGEDEDDDDGGDDLLDLSEVFAPAGSAAG